VIKPMKLLSAATLAFGLWTTTASAETLRVLAWEGYADPDWVKQFSGKLVAISGRKPLPSSGSPTTAGGPGTAASW